MPSVKARRRSPGLRLVGRVGEQADDRATGFQTKHLPAVTFSAQHRRRIVASVYVVQRARVAVQFGVQEGDIAVGFGLLMEEAGANKSGSLQKELPLLAIRITRELYESTQPARFCRLI